MTDPDSIRQDSFEELLAWLGPSREEGALKYETIRARLIRIFLRRGSCDAEDLADITINRVARKFQEVRDSFVGDPAAYFYSFAKLVYLESLRRREIQTESFSDLSPASTDAQQIALDCLRQCLSVLSSEQQNLVMDYYLDKKKAKIDLHRTLATELGLTPNALRLRAHRLRVSLEKCVVECVG